MCKHILVPLDGSTEAEQIIPIVAALAQKLGATVTLLRVTKSAEMLAQEVAIGEIAGAGDLADVGLIAREERREAHAYLHGLAQQLSSQGLRVRTEEREGAVVPVIIERAEALGVDCIAMATHARTGLRRLIHGSIADEVLRHAPCPVLLLRVSDTGSQTTMHYAA